jgi:raffinose/stachyose/melibiose transport system substrate-binding protein
VEGKLYGLPVLSTQVGFFYNLALFDKAGVKADNIKTWDDFIAAVKALQAAGITPLLAGGGDKWPLHFYWSHLALRIGGRAAFEAAMATRGGGAAAADSGFAGPLFVQAGERFKQLADLKPFQAGYIAASHPQSAGQFADGKGAMMLMMDGVRNTMRANASDKQGIPDSQLGWFPFPTVAGGRGSADETLGGMNGWLVTKGAPPEAAAFVGFMGEVANQRIAAQQGFYIPAALGTADAIAQPILRRIADNVARSPYHQLFYDQMLGPAVGAVVNDISADLTSGRITPAAAASKVQQAWLRAR